MNDILTLALVILYFLIAGLLIINLISQDKKDAEIMQNLTQAELDRKTIEQLVQDVLENKWLSREIVKAWLERYNLKVVEKPEEK